MQTGQRTRAQAGGPPAGLRGGPQPARQGPKRVSPPLTHAAAKAFDGRRSRARQLARTGAPNTMPVLGGEWEGGRSGPWEPGFGAAPANRRQEPDLPLSVHQDVPLSEAEQELLEAFEQRADTDIYDAGACRAKFQEWLQNFHDQERRFTSPLVLCQVQYNEILEYTEGWPQPNMLRTAACSVLFDRLVPCYAIQRDSLLERLKDDLLHAVYSKYGPGVASGAAYFDDHTPYFVDAQEAARRQAEVDRRYDEVLMKEQVNASSKKIVKSVEARNLEGLRFYLVTVFWRSWVEVVHRKQVLIEKLQQRLAEGSCQRSVRQLFQEWKLTTTIGHIWKMQQNILYLEEQLDFLGKDNPERLAEAKAKAAAIVQDVDEVNLDEMLHKKDDDEEDDSASGFAMRRPLTWQEKLKAMYRDAGKAKPCTKAQTLDTIAEIYAAKLKHDADQDRTGYPRQPLPEFCLDLFLIRTGVSSNAAKRLCELIAGVRKFESEHPRIKTFSYLMNATNEYSDWDPQAVNFLLCALAHVVPNCAQELLLARLFQENSSRPTIGLMDALHASRTAFESRFSLGMAPVVLEDSMRALAAKHSLTESDLSKAKAHRTSSSENFVRTTSSVKHQIDTSSVILLDEWMEYLTSTWIEQIQTCRRKTLDVVLREQRLRPNDGGVISFVQFQVGDRAYTCLNTQTLTRESMLPLRHIGPGVDTDAAMHVVKRVPCHMPKELARM
jgi:hypothetical protein